MGDSRREHDGECLTDPVGQREAVVDRNVSRAGEGREVHAQGANAGRLRNQAPSDVASTSKARKPLGNPNVVFGVQATGPTSKTLSIWSTWTESSRSERKMMLSMATGSVPAWPPEDSYA